MASVAACSWMVLAVAAHGHDWHRWRAHAPEWSWQWLFPSGGMMGGRSRGKPGHAQERSRRAEHGHEWHWRDSTSILAAISPPQFCRFGSFPASDRFRLRIVSGLTSFVKTTGGDQGQCGGEQEVAFSWLCSARPRSHKHHVWSDSGTSVFGTSFAAEFNSGIRRHTNVPSEKSYFVSLPWVLGMSLRRARDRGQVCAIWHSKGGEASLLFIFEDVGFVVVEVFVVFWSLPMLGFTASLRGSGHARR